MKLKGTIIFATQCDLHISLILLYFFNPTFTGLRPLQQASALEKVQKKLDIKRTSLGSLSEASNVFDPQLLIQIITELAQEANPLKLDGRLNKLAMQFHYNDKRSISGNRSKSITTKTVFHLKGTLPLELVAIKLISHT